MVPSSLIPVIALMSPKLTLMQNIISICDRCTTNSASGTLDPATGTMFLNDANGQAIPGTNISDWADPQGTPPTNVNVGGTSYDVSLSGYGVGYLEYFPAAAWPGTSVIGELKPWSRWDTVNNFLMKFGVAIGCYAGQNPDNMRPAREPDGGGDSSDTPDEDPHEMTNGQRYLPGPNKKGGIIPYNNGGADTKAPDATAGVASYANNVGNCLNNATRVHR